VLVLEIEDAVIANVALPFFKTALYMIKNIL
jgi:hypothetical protein